MISAYIISYNDEVLIADAINSLKPHVERLVVAVSRVPYHGEAEPQDRTADIARGLGCVVLESDWRTEREHRNAAIQLAEQGSSLVIVCESDMVFDFQDIKTIINTATSSPAKAFRAKQIAYWQDRKHIVIGDKYEPVVAIKPGVRVTVCANVDAPSVMLDGVKVHHYNWCAPKDIKRKVKTYHHAPQVAVDWYEKCYLTWKEGEPARFPDCTLEVALANI